MKHSPPILLMLRVIKFRSLPDVISMVYQQASYQIVTWQHLRVVQCGCERVRQRARQRHHNTTRYLARCLAVNYHLQGTATRIAARHSQVTLRHTDSLILYKLVQTPANSRSLLSCCMDVQYADITVHHCVLQVEHWKTDGLN
jgi:hypothetical protein